MKNELDNRLKDFLELYKKLNKEDLFYMDLKMGKVAKINFKECNDFDFRKYSIIESSINEINGIKYQYFIFKNGYCYKDGKLYFKNGLKKEILFNSKNFSAQK